MREDARRLLADGHDPAVEKKRQAQARSDAPTFCGVGTEYVAKLKREARSEVTLAKTHGLLGFANAEFGDDPIREITAQAILKVLQTLEVRGRYESARRLRSTVGSVFRYAIATARAETDPTYALCGALTQVKSTPRAVLTEPGQVGCRTRRCSTNSSPRSSGARRTLWLPRAGSGSRSHPTSPMATISGSGSSARAGCMFSRGGGDAGRLAGGV